MRLRFAALVFGLALAGIAGWGEAGWGRLHSAGWFPTPGLAEAAEPDPDQIEVIFRNHVTEIAANNAYHRVEDVYLRNLDSNFNYVLKSLKVAFNGSPNDEDLCGDWDFRLNDGAGFQGDLVENLDLLVPPTVEPPFSMATDYALELRIAPQETSAECQVSFGIVEATFEVGEPVTP